MATYRIGDERVQRKNFVMPCVVGPRFDKASPEEKAAILKATKWADRITEAEWRALLEHDGCSPSAKSRLKSKAAEWLIALARIAYLRPELFAEIVAKADETYSEQIENDSFVLQTVRNLADTVIAAREAGETACSSAWHEPEDAD